VTGPSGLALVEGCSGTALLLCAGPLLRALAGQSVSRRAVNVAHVLGARQLLQAVVTARRPTRRTLELGATIDALHASTMLAAAAADIGSRRLTLASAATAGAFTAAGVAQSLRQ
jgi:hypothetical protein